VVDLSDPGYQKIRPDLESIKRFTGIDEIPAGMGLILVLE